MNISVIIPAYNEADKIEKTIEEILKFPEHKFQIVVVDDGSSDQTAEAVRNIAKTKTNIKLIRYFNNKGKGFAVRMGLLHSRYRTKLILDADHSIKIDELYTLERSIKKNELVIGNRTEIVGQSISRKVLHKFWKILVWIETGIYKDTQCLPTGTKLLCRKNNKIYYKKIEQLYNKKDYELYSYKKGFVKIKKIHRRKEYEKIYCIKTKNGKSICVTGEHPLLLKNGTACSANKIVIGDSLHNIKKIIYSRKTQKINLFNLIKNDDICYHNSKYFKLKRGRYNNRKKISIDYDVARLLGMFVAEGSISSENRYSLRWCFGINEKEYVKYVNKTIINKFEIKPTIHNENKNVTIISSFSKALWLWFRKNNFAHNSFGDIIFNLSEKQRWAFIDGYFAGDGCIHKIKNARNSIVITVSSSKKNNIQKINCLLLTLGIQSSIHTNNRVCNIIKRDKGITKKTKEYILKISSGSKIRFLRNTKYFLKKYKDKIDYKNVCDYNERKRAMDIDKITELKYNGYVYDITLKKPDYFLVGDGIYVHNCPFKIMQLPKDFYRQLHTNGFAYDVELIYKAKKNGYDIHPINVMQFMSNQPSKVTFRKTIRMLWELINIKKNKF